MDKIKIKELKSKLITKGTDFLINRLFVFQLVLIYLRVNRFIGWHWTIIVLPTLLEIILFIGAIKLLEKENEMSPIDDDSSSETKAYYKEKKEKFAQEKEQQEIDKIKKGYS